VVVAGGAADVAGGGFQPRSSPVRSPIGGSGSPMRASPGKPFLPWSLPVWERSWQMGPASAEAGSSSAPFQPLPSRSSSQTTYQHRPSPRSSAQFDITAARRAPDDVRARAMMYYYLCIICGCQGRGGAAGPEGRLIARHRLLRHDAGAARPCRRSGGRGHRRYSSAYALSSRRCCVHACWCFGRTYILCLLLQFWSGGVGN
jgi:hypothetical protein